MSNFILITRNILRQLFRQKSSILIFIVLPLASIMLSMAIYSSGDGNSIRIGVVNKDNGVISGALLQDINKQDRFKISVIDEAQVSSKITGGKLECAFIIPDGFTDSLINGNPKAIEVKSVQGVSATAWVDSYLNIYISNMQRLAVGANGSMDSFNRLLADYNTTATTTEFKDVKNVAVGMSITIFGIGFLIQFLLLGSGRTASLIIKERQEKTLSRIRCAPVRGYQFMSGNVFTNLIMITFQTVLALVLLRYILKIDMGVSIINLMIVLLPLLIAGIGLTMMLAAFAKTERHLSTLLTMIIYPSCMISGCFWDASMMPSYMQQISKFTPQRWALDGITSLMTGKNLGDITINILVLFAFAAAFFAIAVYGFTKNKSVSAMG